MQKDTVVIWNPSAGPARLRQSVRQYLEQQPRTRIVTTNSREDAINAARELSPAATTVVAAGGDGTINSVVNGLMARDTRPSLAILPLGTGNNLCRSLEIPLDADSAVELLESGSTTAMDVVHVRWSTGSLYFANLASGGNSDRVIHSLEDDEKKRLGAWCYLRSALPVVTDLQAFDVRFQYDDSPWESASLWHVLVANGKFAASGLPVAPHAELGDGLMEVVLIRDGTPLDVAALATEFLLGDYLQDERVRYFRAKTFRIVSEFDFSFIVDGEPIAGKQMEFTIEPRALNVFGPIDGGGTSS